MGAGDVELVDGHVRLCDRLVVQPLVLGSHPRGPEAGWTSPHGGTMTRADGVGTLSA